MDNGDMCANTVAELADVSQTLGARSSGAIATPLIRATHCPPGNSFSTKTKTVIAAIHRRLMIPAANNSAIKNQQQPRQ